MTDERSSAEIEREIEEERHALARSLEDLQAQFSPERIVNQASTYLRTNGGDFAQNLVRQVKNNPLAAAIAGVGITWLLVSSGRPPQAVTYDRSRSTHDPRFGDGTDRAAARGSATYAGGTATYDDRTYPSAPGSLSDPYRGDFEGRVATASGDRDDDGPSAWERTKAKAGELGDRVRGAVGSAEASASAGYDSTRAGAADLGHGAADRWGAARDATSDRWRDWQSGARSRADGARMRASATRDRLYLRSQERRARIGEGTENMSEQARMRVMRAREAAADAQHEIERRFGEARATGSRMYDDQPLVAGAIALAVGAAVGAALPRTDVEDEYIGQHRDRLFDDADRVFHEEAAKLRAVADAALDEARDVADEKIGAAKGATPSGRAAVDAVEGEARSAAERVAEAARKEAEKQNLGGTAKAEADKAKSEADKAMKS